MPTDVLIVLMLVLGICLGALIVTALYAPELRRMTAFLQGRDRHSNARVTTSGAAPALRPLAVAVNDELDAAAADRVAALRHQQEFQRDLSALSHDIRTPLTGAKGYLQLARDERDDDARARHLDAAAARIDATTELLDALFAYTKSTDPDLVLEREPITVQPLVEGVLLGHYPEFEARLWEPAVFFEDRDVRLEGDREALTRIVENLVVNALRHGAGAPRIEGRSVARPDGAAAVSLTVANPVADPSIIDADRLFERFYQADTARGTSGSGLGLSVAANLARAMGAELSARIDGSELAITLTARRA